MKQTIWLITLIVLLSFIQELYSQESDRWIFIGVNDEGTITYYDNETIKYEGDKISVFLKFVFSADSPQNYNIKYSIIKWIIYCSEYKYYVVSGTIFYRNGGTNLQEVNRYHKVTPESTDEYIYNTLCK